MADFEVRAIERSDREHWAPLWRAYLEFYRAAETAEATDATWARIFDPLEPVHAVVAARGDRLVGFSHYLFQRSTWLVESRCYLQDLYVSPAERGGGVGRALIGAVAAAARRRRARRTSTGTRMRPTRRRAGFMTRSPSAPASSSIGSISCDCG